MLENTSGAIAIITLLLLIISVLKTIERERIFFTTCNELRSYVTTTYIELSCVTSKEDEGVLIRKVSVNVPDAFLISSTQRIIFLQANAKNSSRKRVYALKNS